MPDMLVKLYELPPLHPILAEQTAQGITIRRALAPEKHLVVTWIDSLFGAAWRSEAEVAFARTPITCWLATEKDYLLGFGCYDVTAKGFFGPTGVSKAARGRGVGKALLLACLHSLWAEGYAYGIIGGVGPAEFYSKVCGATLIPNSDEGIYRELLLLDDEE